MIYLNEFFPNPKGIDTKGEFIELYNNGDAPVNLSGWKIVTEKGKAFSLSGRTIDAKGYIVLKKSETKLSLRNTAGGLALYDAQNKLVDHGEFLGSAPEGNSFSRVDYAQTPTEHFAFVGPTPGAKNKTINNSIAVKNYPYNVQLNPRLESSQFFAIMIGTSFLLAGLILYIIKSNESISQFFFKGDKVFWSKAREEN